MKNEKRCQHCKQIKSITDFVDAAGVANPRGKYCIACHETKEKEFLQDALNEETLIAEKLKIIYGKDWKNYAFPHYFSNTLFRERDFCPYCGIKLNIKMPT